MIEVHVNVYENDSLKYNEEALKVAKHKLAVVYDAGEFFKSSVNTIVCKLENKQYIAYIPICYILFFKDNKNKIIKIFTYVNLSTVYASINIVTFDYNEYHIFEVKNGVYTHIASYNNDTNKYNFDLDDYVYNINGSILMDNIFNFCTGYIIKYIMLGIDELDDPEIEIIPGLEDSKKEDIEIPLHI